MSAMRDKDFVGKLASVLIDASAEPLDGKLFDRLTDSVEKYIENRQRRQVNRFVQTASRRWDHDQIEQLIPEGSRVLDLGCGNGELLSRLVRARNIREQGIEVDPLKVYECVNRGVSVFQADLDNGLQQFPDKLFEFVILEETLQTLHNPVMVLHEIVRVGEKGIVSFPNFGFWQVRLELLLDGRMPKSRSLPFHWYDTPNIHLCTVDDFTGWAEEAGIRITDTKVLSGHDVRELAPGDNLFAEEVLMVVEDGTD